MPLKRDLQDGLRLMPLAAVLALAPAPVWAQASPNGRPQRPTPAPQPSASPNTAPATEPSPTQPAQEPTTPPVTPPAAETPAQPIEPATPAATPTSAPATPPAQTEPTVPPPHDRALARFLAEIGKAPFATPAWTDVASGLGFDKTTWNVISTYLTESGAVVFLDAEVWLLASTIDEARRRLAAHVKSQGPFTPAQARDLLGTTRKYIIPLLEHFDNTRVTKRDGDVRVMA